MSSVTLIGVAVLIFIVAALLYYQSRPAREGREGSEEGFVGTGTALNRAAWNPSTQTPIAGRMYNPTPTPVPADLNHPPSEQTISASTNTIPLSQQRPLGVPGGGTQTMPREALAQMKDLHELENKISTWLDAAGLKEREQPGSLTGAQIQERILLMARLRDVRDQIGSGIVLDTWKRVADETLKLRNENQGWQQVAPSIAGLSTFYANAGIPGDAFLTPEQYKEFFNLLNAAIFEMQGLEQPDPLQRVRLQQIQVMRQELMDIMASSTPTPNIRMSAAQAYLKQILKPDQPLPTLISVASSASSAHFPTLYKDSPLDVLTDLKNIEWSFHASYTPPAIKKAAGDLMNQLNNKQIAPDVARDQVLALKNAFAPVGDFHDQHTMADIRSTRMNPPTPFLTPADGVGIGFYDPKNIVIRATEICKRIREAFPNGDDAEALGCFPRNKPIEDVYQAETVINTVCDRLRYSVPTVTPEQFGCPPKHV